MNHRDELEDTFISETPTVIVALPLAESSCRAGPVERSQPHNATTDNNRLRRRKKRGRIAGSFRLSAKGAIKNALAGQSLAHNDFPLDYSVEPLPYD
jgi:hypothetical protein